MIKPAAMKKTILFLAGVLLPLLIFAQVQKLDFENNHSLTYQEAIGAYKELSDRYDEACLMTFGETDSGRPLHLFLMNRQARFSKRAFSGKTIVLILNGIHPGEPCGIDASVKFANDLLRAGNLPDSVVIGIIPVYNIGGALNRSCCWRANQDGPEEKGFRGNARNLDLNRDFIKADSRNARSFAKLFHWLDPHIFIDTHTSNGADYQYVITLISTRKEHLAPPLAAVLSDMIEPFLYSEMKEGGYEMAPYVNVFGRPPDEGIPGFNDSPRYSTGYAALFDCIGFTTETHMLKPFAERVKSTGLFLETVLEWAARNPEVLVRAREAARNQLVPENAALNLELDKTIADTIDFLGFAYEYRKSETTGKNQLYYDQTKPRTIRLPYYNYFAPVDSVRVPAYYVVPAAWHEVVERLADNNIAVRKLEKDTVITGNLYVISGFKSVTKPYEGHFYHTEILIEQVEVPRQYFAGDILVKVTPENWRYLLAVLEPKADDSFLRWNFYDEILQQKEWFSDYVFDGYARKMLEDNPQLKSEFDAMKANDTAFAGNKNAQLYWLFKRSPFYEKGHLQYPVMRIETE